MVELDGTITALILPNLWVIKKKNFRKENFKLNIDYRSIKVTRDKNNSSSSSSSDIVPTNSSSPPSDQQ